MDQKSLTDSFSGLWESIKNYVEAKSAYYTLTTFEKVVKVLTSLYSSIFIISAFVIALIIIALAGAVYIGRIIESIELGLLIVGGFFLLVGIVLAALKRKIFSRFIINSLKKTFFEEDL